MKKKYMIVIEGARFYYSSEYHLERAMRDSTKIDLAGRAGINKKILMYNADAVMYNDSWIKNRNGSKLKSGE